MPHSYGYRMRTRHVFARPFRHKGNLPSQVHTRNYHIGDFVAIVGQGNIHKGMPHKYYHGKTGIVWNVTKRAVGVEINKTVGNRIIRKRVHVRIEHLQHSKCRSDFLTRVKNNDKAKKEALAAKKKVVVKRIPEQPRPASFVRIDKIETIHPVAFKALYT